jgi:hypothetical protein
MCTMGVRTPSSCAQSLLPPPSFSALPPASGRPYRTNAPPPLLFQPNRKQKSYTKAGSQKKAVARSFVLPALSYPSLYYDTDLT